MAFLNKNQVPTGPYHNQVSRRFDWPACLQVFGNRPDKSPYPTAPMRRRTQRAFLKPVPLRARVAKGSHPTASFHFRFQKRPFSADSFDLHRLLNLFDQRINKCHKMSIDGTPRPNPKAFLFTLPIRSCLPPHFLTRTLPKGPIVSSGLENSA